MPHESKVELTNRLRREGRWEAFIKHRDAIKAAGVPAGEAWVEAAAEFPPLDSGTPNCGPSTVDLEPLRNKKPVPIHKMITWAFEYLDAPGVAPADAPSAGAWNLREWAMSSHAARTAFFKTFVSKLVVQQGKPSKNDSYADKHDRKLSERLFGGFSPKRPEISALEELLGPFPPVPSNDNLGKEQKADQRRD